MNGAEDVLELLSSHDQELLLDELVETQKQRIWNSWGTWARSVTVLKWTEGHGLIVPGTKALEDIDLNEQQATTTRRGSARTVSCGRVYEGEEGLCLARLWCWFFQVIFWDLQEMFQITWIQLKAKCLILKLSFVKFLYTGWFFRY